tara:strand:- start:317 stop:493 length:177 start_codon:yes stop_codon:yes gene_type:complete
MVYVCCSLYDDMDDDGYGDNLNEKVVEKARELLETSEYLWEKAIEMAEEELGIGYYDD